MDAPQPPPPPPPPAAAAADAPQQQQQQQPAAAAQGVVAVDLSTVEGRWATALGAPDSNEVKDFTTAGGIVGPVWTSKSAEFVSLRDAPEIPGEDGVIFLEIGPTSKQKFVELEKQVRYMIVRPCYESLYEKVIEKWRSRGEDRVMVGGNAGTGKSWFQAYVLRRLMQGYGNDHNYLFVIRQVESRFFLLDLATGDVRKLTIDQAVDGIDLFNRERVLYFFEPGSNRSILPLAVQLSSLTTLSEFKERIQEYKKNRFTKLMFPCWAYEHLAAIVKKDSTVTIDVKELVERYIRFGGIIRHVLDKTTKTYASDQTDRIKDADLAILRATTAGIDSDPQASGHNVSGYLLSFCDIPTAGATRFEEWRLDFTSNYVRSEIRKRLKDFSLKDHIEIVVDRLNNELEDRGGLHLQETVSMLLSQGTKVSWQCANVTNAPPAVVDGKVVIHWSSYRTRIREVSKGYTVSEQLRAPDKVLVSTNPGFPLSDIVFSAPAPTAVIDSFQVSWQDSHAFSVRALYMLREIYLKIQDTVLLRVFFVVPTKEDAYAGRTRQAFLDGSVNTDLKYTTTTRIPAARLQRMWQNTAIYVLKPEQSWVETLRPYR